MWAEFSGHLCIIDDKQQKSDRQMDYSVGRLQSQTFRQHLTWHHHLESTFEKWDRSLISFFIITIYWNNI